MSKSSGFNSGTSAKPRRGVVRRCLRLLGIGLLGLVMFIMLVWSSLAVYYADTHAGPRTIQALLFALASIAAVIFIRPRRYGLGAFTVLFLIVSGWFLSLSPLQDREWAPEVAQVAWAQVDGDRLTIHNIRNFDYRSETDFTQNWEERTYDLSKLRSFDFELVHWGSPAIAHAMVSFGFDDGQFLCVSIETRKEKTESYSSVEGFFRQYELSYIFADERDLILLRSEFRKEEVYLYRTDASPAQARAILMSYVKSANELKQKPEFYNALTTNCATSVITRIQGAGINAKMSWRILLPGYAAQQAYANGHLDASMPYEELRRRSYVNDAAHAVGNVPDFSKLIRAGLPNPAKVAATQSGQSAPADPRPAQ